MLQKVTRSQDTLHSNSHNEPQHCQGALYCPVCGHQSNYLSSQEQLVVVQAGLFNKISEPLHPNPKARNVEVMKTETRSLDIFQTLADEVVHSVCQDLLGIPFLLLMPR